MYQARLLLASLVVLSLSFSGGLSAQNGTPPDNVSAHWYINPGDEFGSCSFPLDVFYEGKGKTIQLPSGSIIATSPGLFATVTNLNDPTKQVTLNITGSFHVSETPDGGLLYVVTGRNLLSDPIVGVVLAIGNVSFAFTADGHLAQPFTMQGGTVIDLCELLK